MQTAYYLRPLTPARAVLKEKHAVIEASAGTGKTFTLEHLVLDLLVEKEIAIEQILVVTFTDAATRELRARIRALIRRVCATEGGLPAGADPAAYWAVSETTRGRLREALFRFDGASISTIHGFCRRILSEQAFLGGMLFEQQQADGAGLFGQVFRETVRSALVEPGEAGSMLRRWVEQDLSLHELENFLYRCHREGCPARTPATPPWDPPALGEVVGRLPRPEEVRAAGAGLFSGRALKSFQDTVDSLYNLAGQIASGGSSREAALAFAGWSAKTRSLDGIKATQPGHLRRAAEQPGAPKALSELVSGLEQIAFLLAPEESYFVHGLLPRVQGKLALRKRSLGLLDYDDMLLGVREALRGPGAAALLAALRRRWTYALVDEFQDTDPVQWEIFKKIFVEGACEHSLIVIGDPKQAIYGFRGADVHTYDLAKKHLLSRQQAVRVPLTANYRSTAALIAATNAILTARDPDGRGYFSGLNRYEEPVECGDPSRFALENGREPAVPVHLLHLYGVEEKLRSETVGEGLAGFIAAEIKRLVSPSQGLIVGSSGEARPLGFGDIYVLTRTGSEGERIGAVLGRHNIPHAFYRREGLYQTGEAEHLHRLLCAVENPGDRELRMSAWLTPFFAVPLAELPAWRDAGEGHPLAVMLHEWKGLADARAWPRFFERILSASGLVRRLVFCGAERALTNYLHLFELLQAEARSRPVDLGGLIRGLKASMEDRSPLPDREEETQRLESDRAAVQILTMHKAKGLEAEVVFFAGGFSRGGGERGISVQIYHRDNRRCLHIGKPIGPVAEAVEREQREEEQRLGYVALTRARCRLYLPYFGPSLTGGSAGRIYGYDSLGPFYGAIQKQLDLLRSKGALEREDHYRVREVPARKKPLWGEAAPGEISPDCIKGPVEFPPSRAEEAARIAAGHRGALLTSYTRIRAGRGWEPPAPGGGERNELAGEEVAAGPGEAALLPGAGPAPAEMPGGRRAGIFLHALLEVTPPEEIKTRSLLEWSGLEEVNARAAALARGHGFGPEHLPAALGLVYRALRTPVRARSIEEERQLEIPGGIAAAENHRVEMSFTYPIPEPGHPLTAGKAAGAIASGELPYRAGRGYLQGLIDLVCEHEGLIYLVDWKSDYLTAYDPDSIKRHMENNYLLQARIYTPALCRLLDLWDQSGYDGLFGGLLYVFVRGVAADGSGLWFSRPPWGEMARWEQELLERREWGGPVIETAGRTGIGGKRSDDPN